MSAGILPAATDAMSGVNPLQGELQSQIMAALWRLESGTVEQVRETLPANYGGAYNTVQTVLNRLSKRALVTRQRRGSSFVYRPRISEAAYLSQTIERTLANASGDARQVVLAELVGNLEGKELADLRRLARRVSRARGND